MPEEISAEERLFGKCVGGRLCLDFVNTVRARVPGASRGHEREWMDGVTEERLDSYEALIGWGRYAGAITEVEAGTLARIADQNPQDAAVVLARVIALREAIYRIFKAVIEGWEVPAHALDLLNSELRIARGREKLIADPHFRWTWNLDPPALDRVLWPVARSAAEILTSTEVKRVGQCPGEACGWLFLDTSRSRRRRWCDMADCGNIAKVRRFRRRESLSDRGA